MYKQKGKRLGMEPCRTPRDTGLTLDFIPFVNSLSADNGIFMFFLGITLEKSLTKPVDNISE